jgi:cytosine/adenosine deaminase-related metal-dependent hydrolase
MALNPPLLVGPDRHGRRIAVVDGLVAAAAPEGARVLACPAGEITAGNVCAHTHLYSGLARYGLPPAKPAPQNFLHILERVWWRLDRALDADTLRLAAEDYVARALMAGTTALVDHHESPNFIEGSLAVLADVCERLGMRALLCYGATERNDGVGEARRGLAECRKVPTSPLIRGLVGLHASFTVSDDTIREAGALARELGTVMHVHVAEDIADVDDARGRGYAGPLERLAALDALPPGSILAHGVHLGRDQVESVGRAGCWLVQNPRSNEGNKVGYAVNLRFGDKVALGTDGWNGDMAEEQAALMRLAAQHGDGHAAQRLAAGHRLVAERFGTGAEPLTEGALGDLVVREDGRIRHVIVGGRVVVEDGRLTGADMNADLAAITAAAESGARRLVERMRDL